MLALSENKKSGMKKYIVLLLAASVQVSVWGQSPTVNNNVRSANLLNQLGTHRLTPGDAFFPISANEKSNVIGDVYLDAHWGVSSILRGTTFKTMSLSFVFKMV
jgi:hypothetical protein